MAIELVGIEDMRIGRGTGKKGSRGDKYGKYRAAIANTVPWFKEQINKRETIRVKLSEIKKEMGREFESKADVSVEWGLKYVLFHEGIWITHGKTVKDENILLMRNSTSKDKLPDSLLEKGEDQSEVGEDQSEDDNGEAVDENEDDE